MPHRILLPHLRPQPLPTKVIVLLLHPPEATTVAFELTSAWQPAVPGADIVNVSVAGDAVPELPSALLSARDSRAQPLVLAGIHGAEAIALRLAFDPTCPLCAGVLASGRALPPLQALATDMMDRMIRLRLLWEERDTMVWADALGELLGWFRAAGLDAQGAVIERDAKALIDEETLLRGPSRALVRMGRIYLAELVAIAMNIKPPLVWSTCLGSNPETAALTSEAPGVALPRQIGNLR